MPQNSDLWRDGLKALFDPCPVGWQVPRSGEGGISPWGAFYTASQTILSGTWSPDNRGGMWDSPAVMGGPAWYPTSGLRNNNRGQLNDSRYRGLFWTSWSSMGSTSYFNIQPGSIYLNSAAHSYGFPVRCIRE